MDCLTWDLTTSYLFRIRFCVYQYRDIKYKSYVVRHRSVIRKMNLQNVKELSTDAEKIIHN